MEGRDDHERYLCGEEDSDDHDQHEGGAGGVPLLPTLAYHPATKIMII